MTNIHAITVIEKIGVAVRKLNETAKSRSKVYLQEILYTNGQKFLCELFSNFGLKFGREVNFDELNNVIKGTFSKSPFSLRYALSKIGQKSGFFGFGDS